MPGIDAFDKHASHYDQWFDRHPAVFQSELAALKALYPGGKCAVEIGLGTGRFAQALGITYGVEPAQAMARLAVSRGINTVVAKAENLPFNDHCFNTAVMVTAICFFDDINTAMRETRRILQPGGSIIIGFIDRDTPLGQDYLTRKDDNAFYSHATLYSSPMVREILITAGFSDIGFMQTLAGDYKTMTRPETPHEGYGNGGFVVVRAAISP
ncbi:MAG: class I SAM-dependent methyltransferase [candidate division Zixibacteria bacterium]|nr:class I SAM-dependent methyltransferase [candidate division Zixibacteria bacterium]